MGCFSAKPGKENEEDRSRRQANKRIEKQLQKDKQTYLATHRLLLLGNHVSRSYYLRNVKTVSQFCDFGTVNNNNVEICPLGGQKHANCLS